jgi:hypothetical protein
MAGSLISVVSVQPYSGELLTQSPQKITITFNQPGATVDQLNYAEFDSSGADFQLERVNRDGSRTPTFDLFNNPPPEIYTDWQTPTGTMTQFTIPLQSSLGLDPPYTLPYDLTLDPGTYEVELAGGTGLSADASGSDPAVWDPSQPHVIGSFTILGAGASLAGATPLGTIGNTVQTIAGALDPDDFHSAVDIYRFDLSGGHRWQVGLAVSAQSIGSSLLPALNLFDAAGNVIASGNAGTGIPSDPNDPYIITGLAPGAYYVGVSGAGNFPYGPAGYDPVMGIPGSGGIYQPGGPFGFQLSLLAQPHDRPTKLVNYTIDHADPNDPSPTGLTLSFNGPVDLSHLFVPDTQSTALEVVDASGHEWPFTPANYDVKSARLTLEFNQPLPAGTYSLIVPAQAGLTDLAGVPVTAAGQTSGLLANWTVPPSAQPGATSDLGVVWPAAGPATNTDLLARFTRTTSLGAQQTATFRWVVTVPGFYKLQTQVQGGTVSIVNFASGQSTVLEPGTSHQLNDYLMYLGSGVYGLRFINVGSAPVVVHWALKTGSLDWEKIVDNGVSQQSALSLMLFSTATPTGGDDTAINLPAIATVAALNGSAGSSGPLAPSLFVTLNTGLIGLPALGEQNIAPIGPMVSTASVSLADSSTGLHPGIRYESMGTMDGDPGSGDALRGIAPIVWEPGAVDQPIRLAATGTEPRLDPDAMSARADEHALVQADWLIRLGSRIKDWLTPAPTAARGDSGLLASALSQPLAASDIGPSGHRLTRPRPGKRLLSTAEADIGTVASLIIAGTVALRLRKPIHKWWRQGGRKTPQSQTPARSFGQGPHSTSTRARTASRSQRMHTSG